MRTRNFVGTFILFMIIVCCSSTQILFPASAVKYESIAKVGDKVAYKFRDNSGLDTGSEWDTYYRGYSITNIKDDSSSNNTLIYADFHQLTNPNSKPTQFSDLTFDESNKTLATLKDSYDVWNIISEDHICPGPVLFILNSQVKISDSVEAVKLALTSEYYTVEVNSISDGNGIEVKQTKLEDNSIYRYFKAIYSSTGVLLYFVGETDEYDSQKVEFSILSGLSTIGGSDETYSTNISGEAVITIFGISTIVVVMKKRKNS